MRHFIAILLLLLPLSVCAQSKPDLVGEIILNDDTGDYGKDMKNTTQRGIVELEREAPKVNPYAKKQEDAVAYLQALESSIENSSLSPIPPVKDDIIEYIATGYLLCSIKRGVCPEFLEAIREIDFINSLNDSTPKCSNMALFWRAWMSLDMQKKLDHHAQINQLAARTKFRNVTLPQYVPPRCETKLVEMLEEAKKNKADFIKTHYAKDGFTMKSIYFTKNMLIYFKNRRIEVFQSVMPH